MINHQVVDARMHAEDTKHHTCQDKEVGRECVITR